MALTFVVFSRNNTEYKVGLLTVCVMCVGLRAKTYQNIPRVFFSQGIVRSKVFVDAVGLLATVFTLYTPPSSSLLLACLGRVNKLMSITSPEI